MDTFFRANRVYAVAGASTNPSKFGNKVLRWYKERNLNVVPINPKEKEVEGIKAVEELSQVVVPKGSDLALSVVTPKEATKTLLEGVGKAQGRVESVWLQPDTYDGEVLDLARRSVPNVITDCILVKGDRYLSKL